jgi:hypothetical protein
VTSQTKWLLAAVCFAPWAAVPAWAIFNLVVRYTGSTRPANFTDSFHPAELVFGIPIAYFFTIVIGLPAFLALRNRHLPMLPVLLVTGVAAVSVLCVLFGGLQGMGRAALYFGYFAIWVSGAAWVLAVWIPQKRSRSG